MEAIDFSKNLRIYKSRLKPVASKDRILELVNIIIEESQEIQKKADGYSYEEQYSELNEITNYGLDLCVKLHKDSYSKLPNKFNSYSEYWINVVKAKSPIQKNFNYTPKDENFFHRHTVLSHRWNRFEPRYTFVYYLQMPNNLKGDDGKLFLRDDVSAETFSILPEENDLIIMDGSCLHAPMSAFDSTVDRIALAGNIGFDRNHMFKQYSNIF